ncbi:LADA_0B08944g1_1 [Lachancea dasiensis]|uniref:LADA_0B08944g1_1 n=1 Tax=Lachancea dasiensis TaxID=1072105 RepID=A0A1G4IUX9_9SACH|nr:LADA_0B08944g1_1 [Lachancea dasiensis]
MSAFPKFKLNTGSSIPSIGLGTWKASEEDTYHAVLSALENGYRHIDTAAFYKNEPAVGKAINDSPVAREDIFVTTKLWCTQHKDPKGALKESLQRLGLSYVDMYLMHWPVMLKTDKITDGNYLVMPLNASGGRDTDVENWHFVKTWELMQDIPDSGLAKAIGVSNFSINNLKEILKPELGLVVPAANQIEIHPQLPQDELIDFCKTHGILVEAYSPLGSTSSPLLSALAVVEVAKKYNVEPAQVLINWGVSRGYCVLPKSVTPTRIVSNFRKVDLSAEDLQKISDVHKTLGGKRYLDADWGAFIPFV